ncbi:uncharacterized protein HD556DRAFT_1450089 [Suillus plorans]|uniref:Uncharacterized protein n=1 Tax=Suillus plorans TaxID=116603 RepID=A0A9P7ADI0_9AGAM|nr:uncharacterized protein HD556DRAFT_1450089 [Suillus plorans]KAG1786106.1 hypothetical protein HD556DRAFT_1450089 [Suillus plorans]
MSGLAALHCSTFAQGFSNNECQAAARALLRHDSHIDGTYYHTKTVGGLHPSYIAFQSDGQELESGRALSHKELIEAMLQDIFDTIATQDRLDGGISLFIQCVGSGNVLKGRIRRAWLQLVRCAPYPNGPQHLPGPLIATGARIVCSTQAPRTFENNLKASSAPAADLKKPASAAISEGIQLLRRHRPADVFAADRVPGPIFLVQPELACDAINFSPPLISIGPNTNAVLDQFKLGDALLPKLRVLVGTVRSSRWESVLRSQTWDLNYEQASILVKALLADFQGVPFSPEIVKHKSSILSVILKWLGILVLLYMVSPNNSNARRRIQQPRVCPKVIMSKEAHALLTANQRTKSRQFKIALDEAWYQIDKATKTIASAHHKSIHCVQNELYIGHGIQHSKRSKLNAWNVFCWKKNQDIKNCDQGRGTLQQLIYEHKEKYYALSKDEQEELLKEYAKWSLTKATGVRTSTKSKVNNITQTLRAVENEEFMHSVMNIDNQDLISKMEGFAIQGVKGAAQNHQQRMSQKHAAIHNIINKNLCEITGDPRANMQWAYYFQNIVQCYQVMIEGWPDNVPFANLSQASSALPELDRLLRLWNSGATCWKTLTGKEFEKIPKEHNAKLDCGEIEDHSRQTRSDKGKKRTKSAATDCNLHGRHKKYKSADTVKDSEHDPEEGDNDEHEARSQSSTPPPYATSNASSAPCVSGNTTHSSNNVNTRDLTPFGSSLDCNAILDRSDKIFGPAHPDSMTAPIHAPSATSFNPPTLHDFTDFNVFGTF